MQTPVIIVILYVVLVLKASLENPSYPLDTVKYTLHFGHFLKKRVLVSILLPSYVSMDGSYGLEKYRNLMHLVSSSDSLSDGFYMDHMVLRRAA